MCPSLTLALLLAANPSAADDPRLKFDAAATRTDQPFAFTLRGVTGSQIRVGCHCLLNEPFVAHLTSPGGESVCVAGTLTPAPQARFLLAITIRDSARDGRPTKLEFELVDKEPTITGPSWNALYEVRLARGDTPPALPDE